MQISKVNSQKMKSIFQQTSVEMYAFPLDCNPLLFHRLQHIIILKCLFLRNLGVIKYICTDQPLHFLVSSESLVQTSDLQYTLEEEAEAQLLLEESHQPI